MAELEVTLSGAGLPASQRRALEAELERVRQEAAEVEGRIEQLRRLERLKPPEALRLEAELAVARAVAEELRAQAAALRDDLAERKAAMEAFQTACTRLAAEREEFRRARERYERYEQEELRRADRAVYELARAQAQYVEEVTSVVTLADEPRALHRLGRGILIAACSLGGLAAGWGLALLLGFVLDSSLHGRPEAELALDMPVLAVIPEMRCRTR
jgi:hypothetical protein